MFEKRKNSDVRPGISLILGLILVLSGVFVGLLVNSQSAIQEAQVVSDVDFSGEWIGTYTQDYNDNIHYEYRIVIEQADGDIKGISYQDMAHERDVYSEARLEGSADGTELIFTEAETLVLENTTADSWCLAQVNLDYEVINGQETLVGTWELADFERDACGDIGGRIILTRQAD